MTHSQHVSTARASALTFLLTPHTCVQVETKQAPFLCLDLAFQYTMLKEGFRLPEDTSFTLVKKVKYRGQEIEAAWALGAAVNLLSADKG